MKFSQKLFLSFLLVGILPVSVLSVVAVYTSSSALERAVYSKLESVRDNKSETVTVYLNSLTGEVDLLVNEPELKHDTEKFLQTFDKIISETGANKKSIDDKRKRLKAFYEKEFASRISAQDPTHTLGKTSQLVDKMSDTAVILQDAYILQNANPIGNKEALLASAMNTEYDKIHLAAHPFLERVQKQFEFYDIFIISAKGDIVYSVFKELDYATSLVNGPYANSGLAQAYQQALNSKDLQPVVVDFAQYAPSYNAPAAFIASPILNDKKQVIGVLAAQFPLARLNAVMSGRSGLGETGESYLVGSDLLMRSDSYLDPENHNVVSSFLNPDAGRVNTIAAKQAIAGKSGIQELRNYRNDSVLSAFAPIKIAGVTWGILVEINKAEAFGDVTFLLIEILILLVISVVIILVVARVVTQSITKPIGGEPNEMQLIVEKVSKGDLTYVFKTTGKETGIYKAMSVMVTDLRKLIGEIKKASEQQASTSHELAATTEQTSRNLHQQHQSTTQVATAMYEMSATVNEVSQNTAETAESTKSTRRLMMESAENVKVSAQEMQHVAKTLMEAGEKVDRMNVKANDISGVLQTIKGIADQTNLLALNAAIEAARAGEQGRGFAVVADEVRNLAQNTQSETEQISDIIESLQKGSNDAKHTMDESVEQANAVALRAQETMKLIQEAVTAVETVSDMTMQIASAAEEQTAVANEINQNVEEINSMSTENETAVSHISQASEELANLAERLKQQVSNFKV